MCKLEIIIAIYHLLIFPNCLFLQFKQKCKKDKYLIDSEEVWKLKHNCTQASVLFMSLYFFHSPLAQLALHRMRERDVTACWDMRGVRSGNISQTVLWLSIHIKEENAEH